MLLQGLKSLNFNFERSLRLFEQFNCFNHVGWDEHVSSSQVHNSPIMVYDNRSVHLFISIAISLANYE